MRNSLAAQALRGTFCDLQDVGRNLGVVGEPPNSSTGTGTYWQQNREGILKFGLDLLRNIVGGSNNNAPAPQPAPFPYPFPQQEQQSGGFNIKPMDLAIVGVSGAAIFAIYKVATADKNKKK